MQFIHAGAIYAMANIASAAVPFLLLPLLTRVLGPAEYAHIVSFALLVTLCLTVVGLNAHAVLGVVWFTLPREEIPAFTGTALGLAVGSTVIMAPTVAAILWLFPNVGGGISPAWGAAAALTAGATVILQCRLVLLQSQHRPIPNAVLQFTASLLNVGLSLVAVLVFGWGGDGRNAGIVVANALMACIAIGLFIGARETRWAPDRAQLRTIITFGAPLIVHTLAAVLLSTSDRWAVSLKLGPRALGVYGVGAQLGMVMAILADAFVKAFGPWLYAKITSPDPDDKHSAVGAIYTAMPAFVCMAAVVGVVLHLISSALLGPQYRAAASVLPFFMLGGAFSGIYLCTSGLYFVSGRTALLARVTLSSAAIGASLTWVLVSMFGVPGAAIGYAATQGVLALLTTTVAMKSFDLPWGDPGKAITIWSRSVLGSLDHQSA